MRLLPLSLTTLLVSLVAADQTATLYLQPSTKGSSPIPYAEVSYTSSGPGSFIRYLDGADPNSLQLPEDASELARIGVMNDKKEVLGAAVNAKYLSSASPLTLRPTIRLYTTSTLVPYYAELSFNPYDAPADRDASSYPLPLVESVGPQQTQQQAAKPVLNKPVKLTQDGKMPVEVQEKTFLQKYWWIIAGGMMMLILGGGGGEEEGGK